MAEMIEIIKHWLKDCIKLEYPKWWIGLMLVVILGIIAYNS